MRFRKLNRKRGYDYSQNGWYFVTIVSKDRLHFFCDIIQKNMQLNEYGSLAEGMWLDIPIHFPNVVLNSFVFMPNHIHGIVGLVDADYPVEAADLLPLRQDETDREIDRTKMKLSKIIHGFKSSMTRTIRRDYDDYNFAWQRSFHDRVIRNEKEFIHIQNYINDNPVNWKSDAHN